MSLESLFKTTLAEYLSSTDTSMVVSEAPTITAGRLKITRGNQEELVSYTGVSGNTITGLTRNLSLTADPVTGGTGLNFPATSRVEFTIMHDQLIDKNVVTQLRQEGLTFATTTARDTALGGDGVCTYAYTDIYITADGLFYNYNLSTAQWESIDTGTTTPNATNTVAGKVELSTSAESIAGTDTGGSGASLSVLPSDIAKNTQSGTFVYGADAGANDTYVISLTPALTTYTTGQIITFKPNTTNTGACTLNINSLGAKNIKLIDGTDPLDGDLTSGRIYNLIYDGTNFVLQQTPERATDAEATTGTNTTNYITPKQAKDNYELVFPGTSVTYFSSAGGSTTSTSYQTIATYTATANGIYRVQFTGSHGSNYAGQVRATVGGIPLGGKGINAYWGCLYDLYGSNDSSTLYGEVALGIGQVINFDALTSNASITTSITSITIKGDK